MKKFVITILLYVTIPLILLAGVYVWTDPFRCLYDFNIKDVDDTNREYLSTELFLQNEPVYHYNSFIFGSSRGGGLNTYQWKQYLPSGAQPFLFQAWSESLTGIELKLNYLNEHHIPIDNALILLDIPGTYAKEQLPHAALSIKHYLFTGQSKYVYNAIQFFNYIQKPSLWIKSIRNCARGVRVMCASDTITNDWERTNKDNFYELPLQDSLKQCTDMTRRTFFTKWERSIEEVSEPLINDCFEDQLRHMRAILEANHTDYHVIITPAPCYTNPAINPKDLLILQAVFGVKRVHNYSGRNEMTEDYNNFSDPEHFGLRVGYLIVEDIYK